jgi:hypothetical protein
MAEVSWARDTDGTLRISVNPRPDGGVTLSTAYLGWKIVEDVTGTRQDLVDVINEHLDVVMPGEAGDEIRFASLAP